MSDLVDVAMFAVPSILLIDIPKRDCQDAVGKRG